MRRDDGDEVMAALEAGIAEADRRNRGDFDGILGSLHESGSRLLADIVSDLRDVLLDRYTDEEARALLTAYAPMPGYRYLAVVRDDVELALRLLNMVASAMQCGPQRRAELFLGKRDAARQAGTRKARCRAPGLDEWIERQLRRNPSAKSPELWNTAREKFEDEIGFDRFRKHVTDARRRLTLGRK